MYEMKILSVVSTVGGLLGATTVVDEQTLVPMSLFAGALVLFCVGCWRLSSVFTNQKRDIIDLKRDVRELKAKQRSD